MGAGSIPAVGALPGTKRTFLFGLGVTLMLLDLLVEVASSSIGLPDRLTRALVVFGMLISGLAFLALAIFMTVKAVNIRALSTLVFAGLFFALSFASFWLMYRAASKQGGLSGEA